MTDPDLSRTLRTLARELSNTVGHDPSCDSRYASTCGDSQGCNCRSHPSNIEATLHAVAAAVRQEQIEQVGRLAANEREARDRRKAVGDLPAALHHDWRAQGMETVLALLSLGSGDGVKQQAQIEELADCWELEGAHRGGNAIGKLLLGCAKELRALLRDNGPTIKP